MLSLVPDQDMYGERAKFLEGVQERGDPTVLSLSQTEEQMLETIQTQQMEIDSLKYLDARRQNGD